MRAREFMEGGWSSTATQNTKITPDKVKTALKYVEKFVYDFNTWLESKGRGPVKMGKPTGSSAYHQVDPEDKEYGDIDLQMIAPEEEGKTDSQVGTMYNKLADTFIRETQPDYVHDEGKDAAGHVIFRAGQDDYIQVDFLWATEKNAEWAQYRSTPERGLKGTVYGNMYSSLGEILDFSIQSVGVQMKIKDGEPAPFARTRKPDETVTVTKDISRFGLDILNWMYQRMGGEDRPEISPTLENNPGLKKDDIQIRHLAEMIKGLAESFEMNDMYGQFNLAAVSSKDEFINNFLERFRSKMEKAASASKFDKAATPAAREKAEKSKKQMLAGIDKVEELLKGA